MKKLILALVLTSSLALTACGGGSPQYYNDYGNYSDTTQNYNQYQNDCLTPSGTLHPNASSACRTSQNNPTNSSSPFYSKNKSSPYYKKSTSNSPTYKKSTQNQKSSPFKSGGSSFKSGSRSSSFKSR